LATFSVQGYYSAAVPAAALLMIAPHTLALFSFNAGARQHSPLGLGKLSTSAAAVVLVQLVTAIAFALVLGPLMTLVYGEDFDGAVPFAFALLPAYALNGCAVVAEGYLQGRGRSSIGIWCRLLGALAMFACVWPFLARWQELGIPFAATV